MPVRLRQSIVPLLVALSLPTLLRAQTVLTDQQYLRLGNQYSTWFFAGQADSLLAHMTPESVQASGGPDGIRQAAKELESRAGVEKMLVEEKMTRRKGKPQYWRESMYSQMPDQTIVLRWVFDDDGKILGIGMNPKSAAPLPD